MMTVTALARRMQTLPTTTADKLARDTDSVRSRRKLTGATFAQALVLGWLDDPHATEGQLACAAAVAGAAVTPWALPKRFVPHAAEFLRRLLGAAAARVVAAAPLGVAEALTPYRLRWQIEPVFKQWKGRGGLTAWRGGDPGRVLCEAYAKLLAAVVEHRLNVAGRWSRPERNPTQASRLGARMASVVGAALGGVRRLPAAIRQVRAGPAAGGRMTKRRSDRTPISYSRVQRVSLKSVPMGYDDFARPPGAHRVPIVGGFQQRR